MWEKSNTHCDFCNPHSSYQMPVDRFMFPLVVYAVLSIAYSILLHWQAGFLLSLCVCVRVRACVVRVRVCVCARARTRVSACARARARACGIKEYIKWYISDTRPIPLVRRSRRFRNCKVCWWAECCDKTHSWELFCSSWYSCSTNWTMEFSKVFLSISTWWQIFLLYEHRTSKS